MCLICACRHMQAWTCKQRDVDKHICCAHTYCMSSFSLLGAGVFWCIYRETAYSDGGYAGLQLQTGIWIARTNLYQYIYMSCIHAYIVCAHIHCICVCVCVCMTVYVYESVYVFDLVCIRCTHVLHIFHTLFHTCRYVCCSYQPLLASIYTHMVRVYLCVYVYMSVCVCRCIHSGMYILLCMYMPTYTCVCLRALARARFIQFAWERERERKREKERDNVRQGQRDTCLFICMCAWVCLYVCLSVCMYVCVCVCVRARAGCIAFALIYIYMYS